MNNTADPLPKQQLVAFWLLTVVVALALSALYFTVYGGSGRAQLSVGQPSPRTYIAPSSATIVDWVATERQRQLAAAQVETIYVRDASLTEQMLADFRSLDLPQVVQLPLRRNYLRPEGVRLTELDGLIEEALRLAHPEIRESLEVTLRDTLIATALPNDELTKVVRTSAQRAIEPVMRHVEAGETVVREGQMLNEDALGVLDALGLYNIESSAAVQRSWILLGVILLGVLMAGPLPFGRQELLKRMNFQQLTVFTVLALVMFTLQRVAFEASPYFIVIMLLPILTTVLVGELVGILWAAWTALAVGLMLPGAAVPTIAATMVGSVGAAMTVLTLRGRIALLGAGTIGGVLAALTHITMILIGGGLVTPVILGQAGVLLGGGVLAGIIALGLLTVMENLFGFLTEYRLTELSSPSSPLLQRLITEAPGTYQHSLTISNMVEQAVQAIGGNSLLARVGALYHDVGKMRRPQFFVENQFTSENPHDKLNPHLSYLIVTSHVRDGLELLREYKMPRELDQFVAEHHGTTVLAYFFKRALEQSQVDELSFRYPGPRPRSKETAILMIADAVESASRTLAEPTPAAIRSLIDRIISQRQQDGQLALTPLTYRDLEITAQTFERMLSATLHRRVAYPTVEELRRARKEQGTRA